MAVNIIQETTAVLAEYGEVPISFLVKSRFRVEAINNGLGGWTLTEEPVTPPYVKDYDADRNEGPTRWLERWDTSKWAVFSSMNDGRRVGGAVVAWNTQGSNYLEARTDIAALWDIRVQPDYRGQGIGRSLLSASAAWAKNKGCAHLKIETQNINVPACRFYASHGWQLRAIHPDAYPAFPDEVGLNWSKAL